MGLTEEPHRGAQPIVMSWFPSRREPKSELVGYTNIGYLSDPQNGRSQMGYVFIYGGIAISWCSPSKQLRLHHLIMHKFWQFMKRVENVFDSDQ